MFPSLLTVLALLLAVVFFALGAGPGWEPVRLRLIAGGLLCIAIAMLIPTLMAFPH
jgi:hypothetical protein